MNRIQDGPTLCFDEADESAGSAPHSVGDPIESRRPVSDSELSLAHDPLGILSFVSPATAKTHVSRAMVKLGARDRAQLVVFAYEAGLVRPGWLG